MDTRTETITQTMPKTTARKRTMVTISEASKMTGIPIPTIRSWERRYSFPAPPRTAGGHRRYSAGEVELLRDLQREISNGRGARDAARVVHARAEVGEGDADRLVSSAENLDPDGVKSALEDATNRLGVEGAIQHVLNPAMNRLHSHRERDGDLVVAQENLLMEEARRWLRCLPGSQERDPGTLPVVLASGEGETNSILLEALGALLALQGRECLVLGETPGRAVLEAARSLHGSAVVLAAGNSQSRRSVQGTLMLLSREPSVRLYYIGDAFSAASRRKHLPGTHLEDDLGASVTNVVTSTVSPEQASIAH